MVLKIKEKSLFNQQTFKWEHHLLSKNWGLNNSKSLKINSILSNADSVGQYEYTTQDDLHHANTSDSRVQMSFTIKFSKILKDEFHTEIPTLNLKVGVFFSNPFIHDFLFEKL